MKSFCLFCANYLPNLGGIERYVYNLAKQLIKRGHSVTVVTSNVFDLADYEVTDEKIEIFRLPCYKVMRGRYPILKCDKRFKLLDQRLSRRHFDLVIINARFYIHSIYAARLAQKKKTPCITIEHGSAHLSVDNRLVDFLGGIYEHAITAVLKKYCKNYYGVSGAAGEWSAHFGIKSKGILYNSVDIEQINEIRKNKVFNLKKQHGIPDKAFVIAFTGRLLKIKGVYELLYAFKALGRDDVYLIFAGDGAEMAGLRRTAGERVIMLGQIDFDDVISLLDATDIYCLPSVSEGMSTAVLEAVATKTFVITTAMGGARELIISDEYGIITKGNTVREITAALKRALDTKYRASATERAYQRLLDGFTWEKTVQALEEIAEREVKI